MPETVDPQAFEFKEPLHDRTITATCGIHDGIPTVALFFPGVDGNSEDLVLVPRSLLEEVLAAGYAAGWLPEEEQD